MTAPAPDTVARVLAAAAVLDGGVAALARVAGPLGAAARAEAARLLAVAGPGRALAIAEVVAPARAARPPYADAIHPEWLEAAVAGDDARARDVVLGAAAVTAPVRVWLERRALGGLRAMAAGEVTRLQAIGELAGARPDWLALRLERLGLRQLAHATGGAPRAELAALAARLGRRGPAFVEASARLAALGERAAARLGPRRAAQARVDGVRVAQDDLAFVAIGARAIAPYVAAHGGDLPWQLAQRLPVAPGRRVLVELQQWASAPLAEAPAWEEIARG